MQRVWRVTDPALHERISEDLAPRQALIADGHHRYATYRRLQAEKRAAGGQAGPWDSGLALLVDSVTYPLRLQAIHRVVEGLSSATALREGRRGVPRLAARTATSMPHWLRCTRRRARTPSCSPTGLPSGCSASPTNGSLAAALPAGQSALVAVPGRERPGRVLLERLWSVDPSSAAGALRARRRPAPCERRPRSDGTAVLLRPVDVADVLAVAARGERMPRKSTSFGPKPRTGLVLRLLDEMPDPVGRLSGARAGGPPRAAHLHLAAARRPVRRPPEPSAQRAAHLDDVARLPRPQRALRAPWSRRRSRSCRRVGDRAATPRGSDALPRHDQAEGHHARRRWAAHATAARRPADPPGAPRWSARPPRCFRHRHLADLSPGPSSVASPVTRLARVDRGRKRTAAICGRTRVARTPVDERRRGRSRVVVRAVIVGLEERDAGELRDAHVGVGLTLAVRCGCVAEPADRFIGAAGLDAARRRRRRTTGPTTPCAVMA